MDRERILYQDGDIIIVNKMPGELSQGDRQGNESLIKSLGNHLKISGVTHTFLAPVHRLDRPASGILIFTTSQAPFTAMTELFRNKKVAKTYWAVVEGRPPSSAAELSHHLDPDHRRNIVRIRPHLPPNAFLSYRLVGQSDRYSFLTVHPLTGKQHQIRVQLAAAGMPIKGDVKYRARRGNEDRSIQLHAREVSFMHPLSHTPLRITAPPPSGILWDLFVKVMNGDT